MGALFSFLTSKITIFVAIVAVCLVAIMVTVVSCNRHWGGDGEPHYARLGPHTVAGVPTGGSVEIARGLLQRRRETINIEGIAAPAAGMKWADEARAHLETAAGKQITIEIEGWRPNAHQVAVYGDSGQCLQETQLRAGWARIDGVWAARYAVPQQWTDAEAEARAAGRGIWGE